MSEETIYDPAWGLHEDDPVPLHHWHFDDSERTWSTTLNVLWGLNMTWQFILGALIWTWYPGMIVNNAWWKLQCPPADWTSAIITATTGVKENEGTAVLTPVGVNKWDKY